MAASARLSVAQIQQATRLAFECAELGRDPILWRRHLAKGMVELIPETVALVYEIEPPPNPEETPGVSTGKEANLNPVLIDDGWIDDGCRASFYAYLQTGDAAQNPLLGAIMSLPEGVLECSAYEIEPEESWRALSVGDYMTDARVDFNCLTRASVMPSGRREVLTLHRHLGGREWTIREQTLVSLLFQSIAPMFGAILAPVGKPSIVDLPPRVIGVLEGFLRGLSSKQVASERGLSVNTVNEYAKLIHRHFGVQSRGELLAHLAGVSHRHQIKPLFGG